jgi:hypothetical protein
MWPTFQYLHKAVHATQSRDQSPAIELPTYARLIYCEFYVPMKQMRAVRK